jgi:hypothetical protein
MVSLCRCNRDKGKLRKKGILARILHGWQQSANGVGSGIAIFFEKHLTY